MCLAIPMKLVEIKGETGVAEAGGVKKEIGLQLLPNPELDDYVMVHAGFAIQKVRREEAEETLRMIREMGAIP